MRQNRDLSNYPKSRPFICHTYICDDLKMEMKNCDPGLITLLEGKFKVIGEMRSQLWADYLGEKIQTEIGLKRSRSSRRLAVKRMLAIRHAASAKLHSAVSESSRILDRFSDCLDYFFFGLLL